MQMAELVLTIKTRWQPSLSRQHNGRGGNCSSHVGFSMQCDRVALMSKEGGSTTGEDNRGGFGCCRCNVEERRLFYYCKGVDKGCFLFVLVDSGNTTSGVIINKRRQH